MKLTRPMLGSFSALACVLGAVAACSSASTSGLPGTAGSNETDTDAGSSVEDSGATSSPSPSSPTPVSSAPPPQDAAVACNMIYEPFTFDTAPEGGTATHGACDQCLTTNCCDATVACFSNNADCLALDQCYVTCDKEYPIGSGGGAGGTGTGGGGGTGMGGGTGGGGGSGTGGGGGAGTGGGGGGGAGGGMGDGGGAAAGDAGGTGDAGVGPRRMCLNACDAAHPASSAIYNAFSACFLTTCKGSCVP